MVYQAIFGINCGVSPGFGVKYPDYVKREDILTVDNDMDALVAAAEQARNFSKDYLSNPNDNQTTVTFLELYDQNRKLVSQRQVLKEKGFDCIKRFEWNGDMLVTRCSKLEHLLATP
ncbi:MAG: hypothetical protein AABX04_08075 [Nanoarchaeota archaeon]